MHSLHAAQGCQTCTERDVESAPVITAASAITRARLQNVAIISRNSNQTEILRSKACHIAGLYAPAVIVPNLAVLALPRACCSSGRQ